MILKTIALILAVIVAVFAIFGLVTFVALGIWLIKEDKKNNKTSK